MEKRLTKLLLIERNDKTSRKFLDIFNQYNFYLRRVKSSKEAIQLVNHEGKFDVYVMDIGESDLEGDSIPFMGISQLNTLSKGSLFFGYSAQDYRGSKDIRDPKILNRTLEIKKFFDYIFWVGEPFIKENIIPLIQSNGYKI